MKIALISPPFGEKGQRIKFIPMAPPTLEYLAGLTKQVFPECHLTLIDANNEDFDPDKLIADIVGISVLTPQAPWAYKTADTLRQRGISVVLGGVHITALPEEAAAHADSLVLGEAESVWQQVLMDAQKGILQKFYQGQRLGLDNLPQPFDGLLKPKYLFGSFFTARGCPHKCSFCATHRFFGNTVRYRPIDQVITEVAGSKKKMFWNIDDNIWSNLPRAIELFREMALNCKGKNWFGVGDLVTLDHPRAEEMLNYARRAGLMQVRVGWESNNPLTLDEFNIKSKLGKSRIDNVKRIKAAGIDVILYFVAGGRQDTRADFEEILKISDELNTAAFLQMTIPLPGTELYMEYQPYLIEGLGWDNFNGNRALFHHPTLSPQEREKALAELWQELYRLPRILKRVAGISKKGFPTAHIASVMSQFAEPKAFIKRLKSQY